MRNDGWMENEDMNRDNVQGTKGMKVTYCSFNVKCGLKGMVTELVDTVWWRGWKRWETPRHNLTSAKFCVTFWMSSVAPQWKNRLYILSGGNLSCCIFNNNFSKCKIIPDIEKALVFIISVEFRDIVCSHSNYSRKNVHFFSVSVCGTLQSHDKILCRLPSNTDVASVKRVSCASLVQFPVVIVVVVYFFLYCSQCVCCSIISVSYNRSL